MGEKYTYLLVQDGYHILDENDKLLTAEELCERLEGYDAANFWANWVYPEGADPEDINNELMDFKDMIDRFERVLSYATGGRMSKTNYTVEAMCSVIYEYFAEEE